jgi:hypothetical protein
MEPKDTSINVIACSNIMYSSSAGLVWDSGTWNANCLVGSSTMLATGHVAHALCAMTRGDNATTTDITALAAVQPRQTAWIRRSIAWYDYSIPIATRVLAEPGSCTAAACPDPACSDVHARTETR